MPAPPADDASSCRGAPPGTLSQLALHSGWRAPGGRSPDAPDRQPPERLSPREAWLLRGGAVLRAHDVQPHFDGVCSALTWMSLLGCSFRSHQSCVFGGRGVIVRRATIFRPSLVATTSNRRTPVWALSSRRWSGPLSDGGVEGGSGGAEAPKKNLCALRISAAVLGRWVGVGIQHATVGTGKHDPNSRDTSPAVPWAFSASMPSVTPPPDALSVVVHRNTISQWRLATVTTETGKPCITFLSAPQVFVLAAQEEPGRPARREPEHPPRGSYCWQAAVVVGGVSALRRGNPICRYRWSKGLTFNPFTLAGRWITAADRMIHDMTMAPDEGCERHDEGRR